jgi:hypothetical protein
MKLTVLTNVFNEEYLLPFWLEHHRKIFDHGIVIDYRSTDSSMDIVRKMCPTWEIRTTRNSHFDAQDIDTEFMDIEQGLDGYKMVLNTTEFLITKDDIRSMIADGDNNAYAIQCLVACSAKDDIYPATPAEFFEGIERVETKRRCTRLLHSYPRGNYSIGRHTVTLPITASIESFVIWFGFYPWNTRLLARKLQIKNNIPERDRQYGFGFHHFWGVEEQLAQRNLYASESVTLAEVPALVDCIKRAMEN